MTKQLNSIMNEGSTGFSLRFSFPTGSLQIG